MSLPSAGLQMPFLHEFVCCTAIKGSRPGSLGTLLPMQLNTPLQKHAFISCIHFMHSFSRHAFSCRLGRVVRLGTYITYSLKLGLSHIMFCLLSFHIKLSFRKKRLYLPPPHTREPLDSTAHLEHEHVASAFAEPTWCCQRLNRKLDHDEAVLCT